LYLLFKVLTNLQEQYGLCSVLLREMSSFRERRVAAGSAKGEKYTSQLSKRLSFLHFVYGKSLQMQIDVDLVWSPRVWALIPCCEQ
jgi:hypothetical protein